MSGLIRIDASELDRLSADSQRQAQAVQDIIGEVDSAVSGTGWQSSAQASFASLWNSQHKQTLQGLQQELQHWSAQCHNQADTARRLNQPFNA